MSQNAVSRFKHGLFSDLATAGRFFKNQKYGLLARLGMLRYGRKQFGQRISG